jgi:hypothetical protein
VVAPGSHHERASAGDDATRIRRPLRIAIGELHPGVQAPAFSLTQHGPGVLEDIGESKPHRRAPRVEAQIDDRLAELALVPTGGSAAILLQPATINSERHTPWSHAVD